MTRCTDLEGVLLEGEVPSDIGMTVLSDHLMMVCILICSRRRGKATLRMMSQALATVHESDNTFDTSLRGPQPLVTCVDGGGSAMDSIV